MLFVTACIMLQVSCDFCGGLCYAACSQVGDVPFCTLHSCWLLCCSGSSAHVVLGAVHNCCRFIAQGISYRTFEPVCVTVAAKFK